MHEAMLSRLRAWSDRLPDQGTEPWVSEYDGDNAGRRVLDRRVAAPGPPDAVTRVRRHPSAGSRCLADLLSHRRTSGSSQLGGESVGSSECVVGGVEPPLAASIRLVVRVCCDRLGERLEVVLGTLDQH